MEKLTLSVCETAAVLEISRGKAYEQVRMGQLPSIRVGRHILVPLKPVLKLLGKEAEESFRAEANQISPTSKEVRWYRIIDELILFLRSISEEFAG